MTGPADPAAPRFVPWLRSGLAASITTPAVDGLAPHDQASVSLSVTLRATGDDAAANDRIPGPEVRLRGPGDVAGIDPAVVLRCDPPAAATDAEPNYLVQIEFKSPDLPWRFTPAAASANRLQPWLVLVVVADRDGIWLEDRGPALRAVLHVDAAAGELPDLRQSWAWAHAQADRDLSDGVGAALAGDPGAFRSRLLCPRRLVANTAWIACVVPGFEAGRRAGLGEPAGTDAGLAWNDLSVNLRLPAYYSWRFRTGPDGDFESLVRRLTPRELPDGTGRRDLDLSAPGGGLPGTPGLLVTYAGALVSPGGTDRPWPARQREPLTAALRALVSATLRSHPAPQPYTALRDDPLIGPPAYAAAQAGRRAVPADGEPPLWFSQLNTEPAYRCAAALGAAVVRNDQEELMAAAWQYAAGHRSANRLLGLARLGWEAGRRAAAKWAGFDDATLIQVAGPALARLPGDGQTLLGLVTGTAVPGGLISGAMRRVCRQVAGFAPATEVTGPALRDADGFAAAWRTVPAPVGADLQQSPSAATVRSAARSAAAPGGSFETALADSVRAALTPTATIASMAATRIAGLPDSASGVPARVWARPRFRTAMYARLAALSPEYLVPGAGQIAPDTIGLLTANQPFVEAFLAGLNNELGREFRWREYPAQLTDTWSLRFWDGATADAADIAPIREWAGARLGRHRPRGTVAADLVLLIKGQLPHRYPDLIVYAAEAQWDNGKRVEAPAGRVCEPVLTATLAADVTVFGFALSTADAMGARTPPAHPGYFFVFEQHTGAPRFGLDVARQRDRGRAPRSWAGLSWGNLAPADGPLPGFADPGGPQWLIAAGPLPGNGGRDAWGEDAAAMARIALQRPVRMLVHASAMLPAGAP